MTMIDVLIENNNQTVSVEKNTDILTVAVEANYKPQYPVLGALVNYKLKELSFRVYEPIKIKYVDISNTNGRRLYLRSLAFVLYKAVKDLYPQAHLKIEHSVSKGSYCEIDGLAEKMTENVVNKLRKRMKEIVAMDLPFRREKVFTEVAIEEFNKAGLCEKALLFKTRKRIYTSIYKLNDQINYFFGYLVPSTSYLKLFDIVKYHDGLLIQLPSKSNPDKLEEVHMQYKLFKIFREHKTWIKILEVPYVGNLNEYILQGKISEFVQISEALHEKKIASIADGIYKKKNDVRLILISGPSSSGKTTFSKRLNVQLRVLGIKTFQVSLDNFFLNRDETPKDENGDYNFETIDAIDINLFNKCLNELMLGKPVYLPRFDFAKGEKSLSKEVTILEENTFIIVEGIHGLNPKLTHCIKDKSKYRIFVSALTQISIDAQNPIPTTDNRLIRRIVRDYQYRGYSALETIRRWPSVKKGEEIYIFPYQENADVMFNSALLYELAVLKTYAEPLLSEVPENVIENAEAVRLLKFLSYFLPCKPADIPPTSILREFLGGSSFRY